MQNLILHDSANNDIHIYLYEPAQKPFKGIVHIIHGASEHFTRYGLFAEFLNKNGFAVIGADLLGHGLSTPTNDYVHFADQNGAELTFESVTLVKDYIAKNYPDLPVFLFGHSMGSFLARMVLLRHPDFYKKAVISGTGYMSKLLMGAALILGTVIRFFRGPRHISPLMNKVGLESYNAKMVRDGLIPKEGLPEQWLTRNLDIQQYYHDSPMCGQPFTVTAYVDTIQWLKFINKYSNIKKGNLETPLFFISGALDPVSNYGKEVEKLVSDFRRAGYKSVVLKLFADDRHEVLNELDNQNAYQEIVGFLDK